MTQEQIAALREIERQLQIIWAAEPPPVEEPTVYTANATDNIQTVVDTVDADIIDLNGLSFTRGTLNVARPITIRNGVIQATANVNDLINITGENVSLLNIRVVGDGTTKRGIAANGTNMLLDLVEIRNIRRSGQECAALGIWNGTGLTVRNSILEGASQSFLAGGAGTTVPNHIPTELHFDNVLFTRPLTWRGQGYACKTAFELKNARNVTVRNSIIENIWSEAQTGIAITLTPSNYAGNSPETTVDNVLFENNTIRNVGGGVSALGFSQHQALRPTTKGSNYSFINNTWTLSRALYGGQGALMQLGWEPDGVVFEGNIVTADGDAFIRVTDQRLITNFAFRNNSVNIPGTYGLFTPIGSRGGTCWTTLFPGGAMSGNTFTSANSIFRTNFPDNTYV